MRLSLVFPFLFGFALFGCGSYDTGFDKVKQGVIVYPTTEFWANDTTNLFVNGPMDSVKLLLKHDEHRKYRYMIRIHEIGCLFPATIYPDTFRKPGDIVDVLYRKDDFSPKKHFWSCRFDPAPTAPHKEKVYIAPVKISDRKYYNTCTYILGWLQMGVSLCVIVLILYLWLTFHRRQKPSDIRSIVNRLKQDKGIIFLAAALFFWAVIGLVRIEGEESLTKEVMIRFFSLTNNAFFLFALPYFRHGISHFRKYQFQYELAGVLLIGTSLALMVWIAISATDHNNTFKWFDVSYSTFVLGILGWLFYASFKERGLPGIAWLSALITVGAIYAQTVPQFPHYYIDAWLFYPICYFTTFVMFTTLLVALTFSWYNEEILKSTIDRFAEIQEQMLSDDATSIQKRDFLLKTIAEGELDVVFAGLDCLRNGMESVHSTELILLRSRYFSARKQFHSGEIAHPDYRTERSAATKGLEHLIRAIFPN